MGLEKILSKYPSLVIFGGKGGVGKTTCAAAAAAYLAESGIKTLLISSDPAPSLSDIFQQQIGAEITRVEGAKNLFAIEIDRSTVIDRWKAKFGEEVYQVASALFPVGKEIVDYVSEAPGIDEEFLLDYILELFESREYEKIVWDTAPAGHTLRLLRFPEIFTSHLNVAAGVYYKIAVRLKKIKNAAGGSKKQPRTLIETLESWKRLADRVQRMLRDNQRTEFIIVTDAEAMPVRVAKTIYGEFARDRIYVGHLIVNNVVSEEASSQCRFCSDRRMIQRRFIEQLANATSPGAEIVEVPLLTYVIEGLAKIKEFSRFLFKFSGESNGLSAVSKELTGPVATSNHEQS